MTNPLDPWLAELAAGLGVDPAVVDRDLLLDVARDAAHSVARPAAPLTTFLVGLAAGLGGGSADAVRDAAATAQRLAGAHKPPGAQDPDQHEPPVPTRFARRSTPSSPQRVRWWDKARKRRPT